MFFLNREDAAIQLAKTMKVRSFHDPLVLAIPRGGVVTGAALARELGADLDVVLARKLRAPEQPEFALGAISESGEAYLNPEADLSVGVREEYLDIEKQHQMKEIARRNRLFRETRPAASMKDRSVIVTDDGIATGSTMVAALKEVRLHQPREVIVAVPVAAPASLEVVRIWADEIFCLHSPSDFWAVGAYYEDFRTVEDKEVVDILRDFELKSSKPRSEESAVAGATISRSN